MPDADPPKGRTPRPRSPLGHRPDRFRDRPCRGPGDTRGAYPRPRARPVHVPPGAGHDSASSPGVYQFRDERGRVIYVGKAKSLRQRLNSLLRRPARPAPAHPADGDDRGRRRVDRRHAPRSRRCSSSTPGSRSSTRGSTSATATTSRYPSLAVTLYEEYPRLQVMRGAEAQGRALLRPVRARLGDPRDARPAAAGVPGPHLLGRRVQAGRPDRPAVPARLHRQVLARPASAGSAPRSTAQIVDDFCDFMAGKTDADHPAGWSSEMAEARGGPGVRAGRPAARRHRRAAPGDGEAGGRASATAPTPTSSPSPRTQLEAAVQVFHVRGGRVRGQRGWVVDKVEDVTTGDLVEQFCRRSTAATAPTDVADAVPARDPGAGAAAGPRSVLEQLLRELRGARVDAAGAAARRQAGAAGDRRPQRRSRRSRSTSSSGPPT